MGVPFLQNSHSEGSGAAIAQFLTFLFVWEALYQIASRAIKLAISRYPDQIVPTETTQSTGQASKTLAQRGPSYAISFLHSAYVTKRGFRHLLALWNASNTDKLMIPGRTVVSRVRLDHLEVATTNMLFVSYLVYDLVHITTQYPKLGGLDTVAHHVLFAICSFINGTYGIMAFPFGWLIVGEMSTIFLNLRWFMLKTGRQGSAALKVINSLFASTFIMTRIGIYTCGVVQLFGHSINEVRRLPDLSGVPVPFLVATCGCILLGWILNLIWGFKIAKMMMMGEAKAKNR